MFFFKRIFFYLIVLVFFISCGAVFFLIQKNWLIVYLNVDLKKKKYIVKGAEKYTSLRKKVHLYYWKDDKFESELIDFVVFSNKAENLKHLINNWLSFLQEERILSKKVCLNTVSLSKDGQQVYFSFGQSPFEREWSIFKKWHFVESMLKTIRDMENSIQYLVLLVGGHLLEDDHLNFSQPWPISGFLDDY
ncbi:hypothetical protein KAT08_01125 [Candidatus Babeliales bacterium]|nr:hypothetical protein [Candidatus Babeliales bacterium]